MCLPSRDRELVQIVNASLADAARRAGPLLACRPGCTDCCRGVFAIDALDAQRLAAGIVQLSADQPTVAAAIEARARQWISERAALFPGDAETGLLGEAEEDEERFDEFAESAPDTHCPALDPATGLCQVYEWRPMICRLFGPPTRQGPGGPLGVCELCFVGASNEEIAACEMEVPHELHKQLLTELPDRRETVIAYALVRRQAGPAAGAPR
jgi:Fe-S-cluster containining protein